DRVAKPAAHSAEPGELLIDRGCAHAAADGHAGQISAAGAALEIGVEAQNPASELPIVPDDAAAVEPARRQEECFRVGRRRWDNERAVVAAYPVTERATDKQTRPIVGRPNGGRLVWTKMVIDAAAKYLFAIFHVQRADKRGSDAGSRNCGRGR